MQASDQLVFISYTLINDIVCGELNSEASPASSSSPMPMDSATRSGFKSVFVMVWNRSSSLQGNLYLQLNVFSY